MVVKFYLRKYSKNGGVIEASISCNSWRLQISTREKIKNTRYWNGSRAVKGESFYHKINNRLQEIEDWAEETYHNNVKITRPEFKTLFQDKFISKEDESFDIVRDQEKTLIEYFEEVRDFKINTSKKRTGQYYATVVTHWKNYANENYLIYLLPSECRHNHFHDFQSWLAKKMRNRSVNNYMDLIVIMLNQLVRQHVFSERPYVHIRLKEEEGKNVSYTNGQAKQILGACSQELQDYCQFIFYTFMRPVEVRNCKVKNINLVEKTIFVPASDTKTGYSKNPEILDPLADILKRLLNGKNPDDYLFGDKAHYKNYFTNQYREILKGLGYNNEYTIYSWKHTGVIKHFLAGFDLRWLMDQAGHRDMDSLLKYLRSLGLKLNRAQNIKAPEI